MHKFKNIIAVGLCIMPSILFADAIGIAAGKNKAIGLIANNMAAARAQVKKACKKANAGVNCAWSVSSTDNYLVVVECPVRVGGKVELVNWGFFSPKSVEAARNSAKKKLKTRVTGNGFTPIMDKCIDVILYDGTDIQNFRE